MIKTAIFAKIQEICEKHGLGLSGKDAFRQIVYRHAQPRENLTAITLIKPGIIFGVHRDNMSDTILFADPECFQKVEQEIQYIASSTH
jgi:hypothetical protein